MSSSHGLRHLPLFRSLDDAQLAELAASFSERKLSAGEVLFNEGDPAAQLWILTEGEIELTEGKEPKVVLRPTTPVGELGSLTGVPRNTTAKALTNLTLLEIDTFELARKFDQSTALGLAFYRGLLEVVSDKVRRDRQRMDDMRANIIRTQKAMKAAREIILSTEETSISKPVCDALDDLIENNRRAHYRVTPIAGHDARLAIDANGSSKTVRVVELSEGYLKVEAGAGLEVGAEISGVLTLPERELPVGGKVARSSKDGILLKLDLLIEEYNAAFLGYITQLQLLDFVV